MRLKLAVGLFVALFPVMALGQGVAPYTAVDADGCIVGRPCASGIPQPPPKINIFSIDADGCVVGQPCVFREWRNTNKSLTTVDALSGNAYETRRNSDGTTDVSGFNTRTGSRWEQHIDPGLNLQFGRDKFGKPWVAPLTGPTFGMPADNTLGPATDEPLNVVYEPSEHERWQKDWWATGGTMKTKSAPSSSAQSSTIEEEQTLDEYIRERTLLEQRASIALVLSRMQPGQLAAAAKAAARERCLGLTNVNARQECINNAEQK
jgi:hypothetical protein